ncbi:hypothetical protein FQN49_004155 [Arthroderma sp. PD_2]|nr:hypothetical protein FQN49_004155 [Arthroderma sp. PD_2]
MGNKVSAVNGVKSPNFYEPGNAVNEVWVGGLEVISRLPFGDSDMAQAGWPKNDYPKFPWRPFVIPLFAMFTEAAGADATASDISRRSIPQEVTDKFSASEFLGDFFWYEVIMVLSICMEGIIYWLSTFRSKKRSTPTGRLNKSTTVLGHLLLCGVIEKCQILLYRLPELQALSTEERHAVEQLHHPLRILSCMVIFQLISTGCAAAMFYIRLFQYYTTPSVRLIEKSYEDEESRESDASSQANREENALYLFQLRVLLFIYSAHDIISAVVLLSILLEMS